jgi:hypothetical protein
VLPAESLDRVLERRQQDNTVASNWNGVANGVQISIAPPEVKANGVKTMIGISKQ